jgi:hypothetical protein
MLRGEFQVRQNCIKVKKYERVKICTRVVSRMAARRNRSKPTKKKARREPGWSNDFLSIVYFASFAI